MSEWSSAPPAAQRIAALLQEDIHARGLLPGARLGREDELVERLGTSRTALREGLRVLAAAHIIRTSRGPGGGVFVANTFAAGMGEMVTESVTELLLAGAVTPAHLMEARIAIEVPLAGAAALAADADTHVALAAAIERSEACLHDRAALADGGSAFHRLIAEAGSNRVVEGITSWMFDVLEPELARLQGPRVDDTTVMRQHRAIHSALLQRDAAAAQDAMRDHLRYLARAARIRLARR